MGRVYIINQSLPAIGYVARTTTPGEEFEMVNRFIDHFVSHYSKLKKKNALVFLEPQIETGYPDIVIAEFYKSPSRSNKTRDRLNTDDLKILFHVQQRKSVTITQLSNDLGYSAKDAIRSVNKLSMSGLVYFSKNKTSVRNVSLRNYCTITRLITIEAKLAKWSDALRQAENNTWFSSESFIMLKKEKCNASIRDRCQKEGIGIILLNGKVKTELKCISHGFPCSYASLQFNEWVYRFLNYSILE